MTRSPEMGCFWQDLIDANAVGVKTPVWTTDWFTGLDEGVYASWITGAWGAVFIPHLPRKASDIGAPAPMPQWDASQYVSANLGGSTIAVSIRRNIRRKPLSSPCSSVAIRKRPSSGTTKQFLFPVTKALVADPEIMSHKYDLYGGQAVNEVFAESAKHVDVSFKYAPFQDYLAGQVQQELSASIGGKGSLGDAFDRLQDTVTAYANDQGYTVSN